MDSKTVVVDGREITLYSADNRNWFYCLEDAESYERAKQRIFRSNAVGRLGGNHTLAWPPVPGQE